MRTLLASLLLLLCACSEPETPQPVAHVSSSQELKTELVTVQHLGTNQIQTRLKIKNEGASPQSFKYQLTVKDATGDYYFVGNGTGFTPELSPGQSVNITGTLQAPLSKGQRVWVAVLTTDYQLLIEAPLK